MMVASKQTTDDLDHQLYLSLICPTFNRACMLRECIVPLMELPNGIAEVVVVDDCSTDGSEAVCRELSAEYGSTRLRYVRLDRNSGAPAARNLGITEARGDFFMFVDSDDVLEPTGIAEMLSVLVKRDELDFVYGRVVVTDHQLRPILHQHPVGSTYRQIPLEIAGYHWHTMVPIYRRRLIERVGPWNTELTGSQDWEYQARVKMYGGPGEFVDVVVGFWRQHDGFRVGTSVFRPDYVKSVMHASRSILYHARHVGFCDQALEVRLAKRLLIHALEWGANGYRSERYYCLRQALVSISSPGLFRLLLKIFSMAPPCFDKIILFVLLRRP